MAEQADFVGKSIGNYRIASLIASGAFGTVYRAQHQHLSERFVAVKLLHTYIGSEQERAQFIQEAQFLEKLKQHHILPILDVGFSDGFPYLISELAPNGSLRDHLRQQARRPMPLEKAVTILTQIGEALQHAHHQHIIHRALKPENILFTAQDKALLADFGIATMLSTASVKQTTTIGGTPPYMAPEMFRGTICKEGDQYALGCIAYELTTGHLPFTAPDFISMGFKHATEQPVAPTHLNPNLPLYVEQAILKAMAKERTQRHADVTAFVAALQAPSTSQEDIPSTVHVQRPQTAPDVEAYKEGNNLYYLKRYDEALVAFEQALRHNPNAVSAYIGKGNTLVKLKRYDEALAAYEKAIYLKPTEASAFSGKGKALIKQRRFQEALDASDQALRLDSSNIDAYIVRSNALDELKRYQDALVASEQALRLDSSNADAYVAKGNGLIDLERYQEALAAFEQALHLDPSNTSAYYGKGLALSDLKQYEEALAAFEQAIHLDASYANAYNGKGNIFIDFKLYQAALTAFDKALRLDPSDGVIHYNKGLALSDLERYQEALAAFEQTLRLDPSDASAYNGKGEALNELKRHKEARQAFEKAQELGYRA